MTGKTDTLIAIGDLHIAAYLVVKGCPLIKIERSGRLGTFYFGQSAGPLISDYSSRTATTEPQAFVSAIRNLREKVDDLLSGSSGWIGRS